MLSRVYCPRSIEAVGRARGIDAFLKVEHPTFQPLVSANFDTKLAFDSAFVQTSSWLDIDLVRVRCSRWP